MLRSFDASLDFDTHTLVLSGSIGSDHLAEFSSVVCEALAIFPSGLVVDLTRVKELSDAVLFALFMAHDTHRGTPTRLLARSGTATGIALAGGH